MIYYITEDGFGIHIFMLTFNNLKYEEYSRLFELFKHSINDKSDDFSYIKSKLFFTEGYYGLYPELCRRDNHCYLKIFVNPRNLAEGKYCNFNILSGKDTEAVDRVISKINEAMAVISDDENIYTFERASLSRVDLCVNFRFENSNVIKQYIKLAKKSARINKGYRRMLYNEDNTYDKEGDKHHFGFENSRFELTIYDKEFQLMRKGNFHGMKDEFGNILRIEVKLKREYIYEFEKGQNSKTEILKFLLEHSCGIMINCISDVFYPGDYYVRNLAEEIIESSEYARLTKDLMKEIIMESRNIDSVYRSIAICSNVSDKKIQRIKTKFAECGLNPTKISLRDALCGEFMLSGFVNMLNSSENDVGRGE